MKNEQTHIIKSQRYEVVLDNASEAYSYQSKISYLQAYQINSILQKVMDQYSSEEFLDQFDEITLDIGTVSPANFEKEIIYKIEEALSAFLKNNSFDNGMLKTGKRIQIFNRQIEQFDFFLRNGYINWSTGQTEKPVQLFQELITNNKEALIKLLKEQGKKQTIRTRLITQLNDAVLEQIVEGVAGNEGAYINQYRSDVIKKQKDEKIVDTSPADFRNATWEITLSYIFVEVSGYYNRKNFLKHLIYKIAQKYRVTYKSLLGTIVLGIKDKQDRGARIFDLEKLLMTLQNDEEKKEEKFRADFEKRTSQVGEPEFIEIFQYFITNSSLPIGAEISSLSEFYKKVVVYIDQNPAAFYNFFDTLVQRSSNVDYLIRRFPDAIIYKIISASKNTVFIKLTEVLSQVIKASKEIPQGHTFLNALVEKQGLILLTSYKEIRNKPGNDWEEFLFQVVCHLPIDKQTIRILNEIEESLPLSKNERTPLTNELLVNRIEVIGVEEVQVLENEVYQNKFSIQLYETYNQRKEYSLQQFQSFLKKEIYTEEAVKLTYILLEVCAKSKIYTIGEIKEWILKRTEELQQKGKNAEKVIRQILKILKQLEIDTVICLGVEKTLEAFHKNKHKKLPKVDSSDTIKSSIPDSAYKKLIEQIYDQFYKQTKESLYGRARRLFVQFSEEHKVSISELKASLRKQITHRKDLRVIKRIVEGISSESIVGTPENIVNTQYKLDLIQYFSITGKLPWWAKDIKLSVLQEYLAEVLTEFPKQFLQWYVRAKNQQVLIGIMSDGTYDTFLKQVNPSANAYIFSIKKIIDELISEQIKGIRSVTDDELQQLRHMIIAYALKNVSMQALDFTKYLVNTIAIVFKIDKKDSKVLVKEQINNEKTFQLKQEIVDWLGAEAQVEQDLDEVTKLKALIEAEKNWSSVIHFTPKTEIFSALQAIQKTKSSALLFHLKRTSFRKQLVSKLNHKEQIAFVQLFMDDTNQSRFSQVVTMFEKLRKHITGSQYQNIWLYFLEVVLFHIAIDKPTDWTVQRWSTIVLQSVRIIIKDTVREEEIISEIAEETKGKMKEMLQQTKEALEEKKKETFTQEKKEVPEEMEEETIGDAIYIENAGMVILGPYIFMLFDRLGLIENGEFKDAYSIHKGIHILQYAVTGKEYEEEQQLTLNKIICGLDIHTPIQKEIPIAPEEKELVEGLLKAIITNWNILKNTSIEGLRESFLCREARIVIEEDSYVLTVEQKAFDMLLDQIPWSIAKLKLSWMQKLVEVVWRQ